MSAGAYASLMRELVGREPEAGGLLVGPKDNRIVTHFVLDEQAVRTPHSLSLGHEWLNEQMQKFRVVEMDIKGFVHSHPAGQRWPSDGDQRYLQRVLGNPKNQTNELYFPIVCDGRLFPYIVIPPALHSPRWAKPALLRLL